MSIISNRHQVTTLEKNSKPLSGQRLARVIAKADKNGNYPSANLTKSVCVSIPPISTALVSESINFLLPHIVNMLSAVQDSIIREYIIEYGHDTVSDDIISVDKCVEFLDASAKGNRLTKEYLEIWFTETYSESAAEFIATAMKFNVETLTEQELHTISQKVKMLCELFSGFSSARYQPAIPKCKAMIKFGEYLGESADSRMQTYLSKAATIQKELESEMSADALGF